MVRFILEPMSSGAHGQLFGSKLQLLVWSDALKAEMEDRMKEEEEEIEGVNDGKQVFVAEPFSFTTPGHLETTTGIF